MIPILIHLISATTSLHEYTVTALFDNIKTDLTNQPLNQVASWCIGEYADVLINKGSTADGKFSSFPDYEPFFALQSTALKVDKI